MTNADLITEARRVVLDHKAVASFRLIDQLADALEASEARVARLRAHLIQLGWVDVTTEWPADLLEAVRHFTSSDHFTTADAGSIVCANARDTLVRYGLIEEREEARA